jgi:epoxyqueuosine reductase
MTDLSNSLKHFKNTFELNQIEIQKIKSPISISFYEKWLANNYQGNMQYLATHLPIKKNPLLLDEKLKSVISLAQSYFPAVQAAKNKSPARIALYAHNEDYHIWLKQKLVKIIEHLKFTFPEEIFLPFVDSGPILERDMAYQSGLGWFGKNSCLIHPQHGSLFFVAEILTSLETSSSEKTIEPIPDFCGKCTKCIDICPTEALVSPKVLKADQCISYLTIEAKSLPPVELRKKMGDWFFGCDLCQTVCPWNEKAFRFKNIEASDSTSTELNLKLDENKRTELIHYFRFLLTSSHKQIQKNHFGSPLSRAGAKGLKRNALIVIANQNLTELKSEVSQIATEDLKELSSWTLEQLN